MELTQSQWLITGLSALCTGMTKTGIAGLSVVLMPLMAEAFPAKISVGVLLPTLITGDIIAVIYYRRFARWRVLFKILPIAMVGICCGYFLMDVISSTILKKSMGALVLLLITMQLVLTRVAGAQSGYFKVLGPVFGILAGVTTMMANAAGPFVTIYLLWMKVGKEEFIGTAAWFFFIVNIIKVPLMATLGLITFTTLRINFMAIPCVILGAMLGIFIIKKINQRAFEIMVLSLAAAAGLHLLLG